MNTAVKAYQRAVENQTEQLILDNLEFVRKILSMMSVGLPSHCDRDNLEQAGMVGLVEAARNFDPSMKVAFRTFAYNRIRGAIVDEMRRNSMVPQKSLERIAQIRQAYERLPRPVTPEMLAQHLNLTIEEIGQLLETMKFVKPESWNDLEAHVAAGQQKVIGTPDEEALANELNQIVANCIEKLPDRERLILTLYYTEDLTLAEIGQIIDLSESRVSRLLASAKFRLKEMIEYATR